MTPEQREQLIRKFADDRVIAHQSLFTHRHGSTTPSFHDELIELMHSRASRLLVMAFRGGGKSTLAEEMIILAAAMKLVKNVLIIGANSERANDRLRAIKHDLVSNELLTELFGDCAARCGTRGASSWQTASCCKRSAAVRRCAASSITTCGRISRSATTSKS